MSNNKKKVNVRALAGTGMLTAVAFALQYIEVAIPIMPAFIKLDFSDLPALIGAFAYGPVAGVIIELLKNVIHLPFGSTMGVGEVSNFVLGAVFAGCAGLVYKKKKTKTGAVLAGVVGALAMAIVCIPSNYFVVYPLYYSVLGFPEPAVLGMYQVIRPSTKSILEALFIFNLPFTFVKGMISVVVTMLIYQPLRPLLKGKNK